MPMIMFLVYGSLIGIALTLLVIAILDRVHDKKNLVGLSNSDGFCLSSCKNLEKCFSEHKDVDEAFDVLVNNYCVNCPINLAMDYLEDDEKGDKKHGNQDT